MQTKTRMCGMLIAGMTAIVLVIYGCRKNESGRVNRANDEVVLFEDKNDGASYKPGELLLGANVKKVTAIGADHPEFDRIRSSVEWKQASRGVVLDLSQIRKTYVHNGDASLITIPIVSNANTSEYFNVYVRGKSILITRFSEIHKPGGFTTCKVESATGELYYQFDMNSRNQTGNWRFDKEMPKLTRGESSASLVERDQVDCGKKKFSTCMNCVLLDVCGSDWVCAIACGLAIPSCVGAAALYCVLSS